MDLFFSSKQSNLDYAANPHFDWQECDRTVVLSRPFEILGAPASNAGDAFHEAWALSKALKLLDHGTQLTQLTVEGVRDAAETDNNANWDGVDCALYYDDHDFPDKSRIELIQLKYSVASKNKRWTLSRFCSSNKKNGNNSVARRLADAYKGASKGKKADQIRRSITIKLVTNQPISTDLESKIAKAAEGKLSGDDYDSLKRATGLGVRQLKLFFEVLSLQGDQLARAELREENTLAVADLIQNPVKDMADSLQLKIQERMGPEPSRTITRETVLSWFKLGRNEGLFPCEPRLQPAQSILKRQVTRDLANALAANPIVVFHGKGGCGKTTTAMSLEKELPEGSKVVIYDCYGAGSYRDQSRPRHQSFQAFTQLSNELARLTNSPLFFPYQDRDDMAPAFRHKLETASKLFAKENPASLLVFVVDAADNAVSQANSYTPPHRCFVHQLISFRELPENVRFVVSSRSSRLDSLNLPEAMPEIPCPPFLLKETEAFVELNGLKGSEHSIVDFHELSRAVPRIQANALAGAASLEEAIQFLQPNGKSLSDLFGALIQEAFDRGGIDISRKRLCAALTELAAPIPVENLAGICGLSNSIIEDLANDLGLNLRVNERGIEFSNEDFEAFCEDEGFAELRVVRELIADHHVSNRLSSSYAATHLFDALIAAERKPELGKFLAEQAGTEAISDPVLRRRVDLARLQAALHIATNEQDEIGVGETIFVGAEALRTAGKVDQLIVDNSDLSAAFVSDTVSKLILNDPGERSRQGPVLMQLAADKARQHKSFECRLHLRAANEWMDQTFSSEDDRNGWHSQDEDIVARLFAYFVLGGWSAVDRDCERWTPEVYGIALRKWTLRRIAIEQGPEAISGILGEVNPKYRFLAINCLSRAGRSPSDEEANQALINLAEFDFEKPAIGIGVGPNQPLSYELAEEILFFLENLVGSETASASDVQTVLQMVLPVDRERLRGLHLSDPYHIDLSLRSSILASIAQDTEVDLGKVFPKPVEPDSKDRSSESYREFRLANERYDQISKVLPSYVAYANFLKERNPKQIKEFDQKLRTMGSTSGRSYHYSYIRSLLRRRATDALASSNFQPSLRATFLTAALAENHGFDGQQADLCEILLHDPNMQSAVARELDSKSNNIRTFNLKATEKSEYLVSIARVFLIFSRENAAAVFSDALKIAEEVDLEAIDVLHALCRIVRRGRPDTPSTRKLIGDFARLVRFSGDLLQSEDSFPQEEAVAAMTMANPPAAAMTVSRWSDEGFVDRYDDLQTFLATTIEMDWLGSEEAFVLAQILRELPTSVEAKILERTKGMSGAAADGILAEVVKQRILETTPHSQDRVSDDLEELCKVRDGVDLRLDNLIKIKNFKLSLPHETNEPASGENETDSDEADLSRWESVDPLHSAAIREAQEAERKSGRFLVDEGLVSLRRRVGFPDRVSHLNALAECARSTRFVDSELKAIFSALDEWSDRATKEWCLSEMPKLTIDLGGRTMGYNWYHGEQFSELQSRSGLPPEGRRKVVTELVEKNAGRLGGASLLKLLAEFARNLELDTADALLARLIARMESRLKMDEASQKRFDFDPTLLPSSTNEVVSALVYRYLGDIDARVRWRASHALRCAAQLGSDGMIEGVLNHAISKGIPPYTFDDCPFQVMNADLQLSIVFARLSHDKPELVSKFETELLGIWSKCQPHILIGHFLSRAFRQTRIAGQIIGPSEADLAVMNGTAAKRVSKPKENSSHHFHSYADPGERFSFDSVDIVPYWYGPALRIFADLRSEVLIQTAEKWIVDRWGGHKESGHWENEPRRSRLREDTYGQYSTRHGSHPTIYRHSVYLQWHGLLVAVGELLKSNPLVEMNEDHYGTFEEWIERRDTTYPEIWVSDILGTLPLSSRYWLMPEPDRGEWVNEVNQIDPGDELFAEDGAFVLCQHRELHEYAYGKHAAGDEVTSKAVFVPQKTSRALLRAYAATQDYFDIFIPDRDDFEEVDERKREFTLIPAICRPLAHRDLGIDEEDPRRFGGRGVQAAPSAELLEAVGLKEQCESSTTWGVNADGLPLIQYRGWSTTPNDSDRSFRHQSYSFIDGYRLCLDTQLLRSAMETLDCDVIVIVNFERSTGSDYDGSEKRRIARKRVEVIRLDRDGKTETTSGSVGTWA